VRDIQLVDEDWKRNLWDAMPNRFHGTVKAAVCEEEHGLRVSCEISPSIILFFRTPKINYLEYLVAAPNAGFGHWGEL
jgi:hypothetical protein